MSVPMPPSTTAPPQAPPTPAHHHQQQQQQQPPIVQKLAAVNEQAWLTLGAYTWIGSLSFLFFTRMGLYVLGVNVFMWGRCEKKKEAEREEHQELYGRERNRQDWGEEGVCHIFSFY